MLQHRDVDLAEVTTLLCDADGTLFPSEEPAFDASATVVNQALESLGGTGGHTGADLRRAATGRNFRSILVDLAAEQRLPLSGEALEGWVAEEVSVVTQHLRATLRRDATVREPLVELADRLLLAVVSSSALRRLAACFTVTDLDRLFPTPVRFSAQDSLLIPTSKPDPAVYLAAREALGLRPGQGLAVEDAVSGVESARAAGLEVVGTVQFVPADERSDRVAELVAAGAFLVVDDWRELEQVLSSANRLETVER